MNKRGLKLIALTACLGFLISNAAMAQVLVPDSIPIPNKSIKADSVAPNKDDSSESLTGKARIDVITGSVVECHYVTTYKQKGLGYEVDQQFCYLNLSAGFGYWPGKECSMDKCKEYCKEVNEQLTGMCAKPTIPHIKD